MKSRLTTKFVNKYLLPHRSIIFDDQQSFEKFLQKRLTMNEKSTSNLKL